MKPSRAMNGDDVSVVTSPKSPGPAAERLNCVELCTRFTPHSVPTNIWMSPRVLKLMPTRVALSCTSAVSLNDARCVRHWPYGSNVPRKSLPPLASCVLPRANSPPHPSKTQMPLSSYPQVFPSRQLAVPVERSNATPARGIGRADLAFTHLRTAGDDLLRGRRRLTGRRYRHLLRVSAAGQE